MKRGRFVHHATAETFLPRLPAHEGAIVDLFLVDPPYYGILDDSWDNQWSSPRVYLDWLFRCFLEMRNTIKPHGSVLLFQAIGAPEHVNASPQPGQGAPIDSVRQLAVAVGFHYRNWITWKKRRAYGKSHDYLFCREEILWFSAAPERTAVTFNIPLTDQLRGYEGWDPLHPAKSDFKRVSNVWDDIPELMRPIRAAQKPEPLIERLIATHSNAGDLVCDWAAGYGTTGMVAHRLGRRFVGCEPIEHDALQADRRVRDALTAA